MTDHKAYRKWFSRVTLLLLTISFSYVVLQPEYNFAHWVPHRLLRDIGVPYAAVLWFERNAEVGLHLFGSWALCLLMFFARLPILTNKTYRPLICMLFIILVAEFAQWRIGRGWDFSDILFGTLGCFMAYFTIENNN